MVYLLNLGILLFLAPLVAVTHSGEVRCSETSVNVMRDDVERYGRCVPYQRGTLPTPCDNLFTPGVDYVYIPYRRALGSIETLNDIIADTNIVVNLIGEPCKEAVRKAVCYFYYPPCGNSTTVQPPKSICQDECFYVKDTLCPVEWALAQDHFESILSTLNSYNLHFVNCGNPATYIEPLPHCCFDGLVQIPDITVSSQRKVPQLISPEGGRWSERVSGHISYKKHHHLSKRQTQSTPSSGQLRLVQGNYTTSNLTSGRLEIYLNGQWGTVCDDLWGQNEANVACQQLGYTSAAGYGRSIDEGFAVGRGRIWLDNVDCSSSSSTILSCSHDSIGVHDCNHTDDIALHCSQCTPSQFRCENGQCVSSSFRCNGISDGCSDGSDERGCPCTSSQFRCDNGQCTPSSFRCNRRTGGCADGSDERGCTAYSGDLRLARGTRTSTSYSSGRLEIYLNGEWGTVCDDGWDLANSDVACRQLGYSGAAQPTSYRTSSNAGFGIGTGRIWLDDVNCQGSEARLISCSNRGIEQHDCGHSEDVAIYCTVAPLVAVTHSGEVRCSETSVNVTRDDVERYGRCVPYQRGTRPTPCDNLFTPGVDYVYIPYRRALGSIETLNSFIADTNIVVDLIGERCREAARKAVCYFYYPPCGNSTTFQPPKSICQDECLYVKDTLCPVEWALAQDHFQNIPNLLNSYNLHFINCSNPATYIEPLPRCCFDGLVQIPETSAETGGTSTPTISPSHSIRDPTISQTSIVMGQTSTTLSSNPVQQPTNTMLIISSSVSAAAVFLMLIPAVVILGVCIKARKGQHREGLHHKRTQSIRKSPVSPRYFSSDNLLTGANHTNFARTRMAKVTSGYLRQMSEAKMLIPVRHICLKDCIGQGEFGIVYRAHLIGWEDTTTPKIVAVKTLKPMFSMKQVSDIMAESLKMKAFSHPNVLSLIGVCTDAGESPYLVMPYMEKRSLLAYLKKERPNLTIAEGASEDLVVAAQKKLLSMCLQIVKGMEYLAREKFVHRDLAARNCMIDADFVIKVADFGLSEDIYARNYFRQAHMKEEGEEVKLPARWMALESLMDGMFSEKSDVWSYGVTCWEVFSLGKTPYPGIDPFSLMKYLESGGRLERPANAACSREYYEVILSCWKECAAERPSFSDLVTKISCLLEDIAGYMDFSVTPRGLGEDCTTQSYDHLTEHGKDHCNNSDLEIDKDLLHENSEIAEGGDNHSHQETQD